VTPVLQALVLAERVFEDKGGQKIIAGTFNHLQIRRNQPPEEIEHPDGTKKILLSGGQPGSPYAYISLTDVCDNTVLEFQFVSLTENKVVFEKEITVSCSDRLETVEIILALPPLRVPGPGVYAFEIVCEGEVIGSHRLIATAIDG